MNPYVQDDDFTLYNGDVREVLRSLPDESVHCCLTSPPYWGLRDYGTPGQLGLETTPDEYVANMVAVFREVRRVLRRDGTCWLNIGDSYATNPAGNKGDRFLADGGAFRADKPYSTVVGGLKQKDMCGVPWRLAFALQADGWYLRADIIWSKPNPMPESVTDRPTKAHEYVFLLSKSPRYFFDADAVREPAEWARWGDQTNGKHEGSGSAAGWIGSRKKESLTWSERKDAGEPIRQGMDGKRHTPTVAERGGGRNIRSVWEIATQPYAEAHFATFPEALVERCILAGTSERGCCPECGAPWERETESSYDAQGRTTNGPRSTERRHESPGREVRMVKNVETTGWRPTCDHGQEPVPCTVLDPFMGSGTTALVARRHGRKAIGIELNESYCQLAARRLQQLSLLAI